MEITGHRCVEGVQSYKHTSTLQKQHLSDILNCQEKQTVPINQTTVVNYLHLRTCHLSFST